MKVPAFVPIGLISVGLLILVIQSALHVHARVQGKLRPFDEDGERVLVPFVGTMCLGGGIFLLVLTSGRKE